MHRCVLYHETRPNEDRAIKDALKQLVRARPSNGLPTLRPRAFFGQRLQQRADSLIVGSPDAVEFEWQWIIHATTAMT